MYGCNHAEIRRHEDHIKHAQEAERTHKVCKYCFIMLIAMHLLLPALLLSYSTYVETGYNTTLEIFYNTHRLHCFFLYSFVHEHMHALLI